MEGFKPFVIYRNGEEIVVGAGLVPEDDGQYEIAYPGEGDEERPEN